MQLSKNITTGTVDALRQKIASEYAEIQSWRKVAAPYGIHPNMARMIANGYQPGLKIRRLLGLPAITTVTIMLDEPIPDGAQVLTATRCECGRWYVSNCPARRKCFICRPYGGKR